MIIVIKNIRSKLNADSFSVVYKNTNPTAKTGKAENDEEIKHDKFESLRATKRLLAKQKGVFETAFNQNIASRIEIILSVWSFL